MTLISSSRLESSPSSAPFVEVAAPLNKGRHLDDLIFEILSQLIRSSNESRSAALQWKQALSRHSYTKVTELAASMRSIGPTILQTAGKTLDIVPSNWFKAASAFALGASSFTANSNQADQTFKQHELQEAKDNVAQAQAQFQAENDKERTTLQKLEQWLSSALSTCLSIFR